MLMLYASIILLSINFTHASTHKCVTCPVDACQDILDEQFFVEMPAHSSISMDNDSMLPCWLMNHAIETWLQTDSGFVLAALACEQLVVLNQTQIGCESKSMAIDPTFRTRCETITQNNDIPYPERITQTDACRASNMFVDSLRFDIGPVSVAGCTPCRLHACDGWSTPSTQSSMPSMQSSAPFLQRGKVELYLSRSDIDGGITCESLQRATHALASAAVDPSSPHSRVIAMNATCFPLAQASNEIFSDHRCGLSAQLYDFLDPVLFTQLPISSGALGWPHVCPRYLRSVYAEELAVQLVTAGYCNSPTTALLKFVADFVENATISSSSTGSGSGDGNNASSHRTVSAVLSVMMMVIVALVL